MSKRIYTTKSYPELSVVNNETGEIISGVAKTVYTDVDDFIMCFLNSISDITKLEGNYIRVLMYCWKFSTFNPAVEDGNIIYNNKLFKNKIRENGCNLSDPVIDKAFHVLTSNGFLIKKCRATYMLNPEYFFRGNLTSRSKIIRSIALNCDPIMKNK